MAQASILLAASRRPASAIQFSLTIIIRSPGRMPSAKSDEAIWLNGFRKLPVGPRPGILDKRRMIGSFRHTTQHGVMQPLRQILKDVGNIELYWRARQFDLPGGGMTASRRPLRWPHV